MKILSILLLAVWSLQAGSLSLETYLTAVESSSAVASIKAQAASRAASQSAQTQSNGFQLSGEMGYAADKNSDRDAIEYHVAVEKQLFFGNNGAYVDALKLSSKTQQNLQINQLKNIIYEHYINACTLNEKSGLLSDAKERNIKLTQLISEGVQGGEFDRSALLRSELVVQALQLRIRKLNSQYFESLQALQLYSGKSEEPLCQDLPFKVVITQDLESDSLLYQYLKSEITTTSRLHDFRSTTIQEMTLGVGYDNEMDLSRAIVFMQIPLTQGSRRSSEREAAVSAKMAAQEQLIFSKKQIESQIRSYTTTQQIRQESFNRLNDILVPKAYETSVLLLERFMGSEGSYLAYINSQTMLFDLLLQGIDTHSNALLAQVKLYQTLGIDPQRDLK